MHLQEVSIGKRKDNFIISLLFLFYSLLWLLRVVGFFFSRPIYQFIIEGIIAIALIAYGRRHGGFISQNSTKGIVLIKVFGVYNIIMFLLSLLLIEYIENLPIVISTLPGFLLIFSVFAFYDKDLLPTFIKIAKYVWLPIFVLVLLYYLFKGVPYGSSKSNYYFLVVYLLFPFIKKWARFFLFLGFIAFIYVYLDSRSMVGIFSTYLSSYIFVYKMRVSNNTIKVSSKFILVLTLVLFCLSAFGVVNVLTDFASSTETVDSRSGIYSEVGKHLKKNNGYIFGTPGKGYEATSFLELNDYYDDKGNIVSFYDLWKYGRMSTESGILTLVLQGGLVNAFLITIIFFVTINYVCRKSHNRYCLYVSLLLSIKYMFMYVDGALTYFSQSLIMWIMFAICLSHQYLNLTDEQIESYFRSII